MDSITRKAAEFVANFDLSKVPTEAVHAARIGIVDCVGTMLAERASRRSDWWRRLPRPRPAATMRRWP